MWVFVYFSRQWFQWQFDFQSLCGIFGGSVYLVLPEGTETASHRVRPEVSLSGEGHGAISLSVPPGRGRGHQTVGTKAPQIGPPAVSGPLLLVPFALPEYPVKSV